MLKKIIFSTLFFAFIGCYSQKITTNSPVTNGEIKVFKTNFNNETYVWEDFVFPTNRTSGVQ